MQAILVEADGRTQRFDRARVLSIGRSPDADIQLPGETVSREHLELRPVDDGWMLVDIGSRHGTHVDGHLITEIRVDRPVAAYLGIAGSGSTLRLTPEAASAQGPAQPTAVPHPEAADGPARAASTPATAMHPPGGLEPGSPPAAAAPAGPYAARPQPPSPPPQGGLAAPPGHDPSGLDPALAMTQAVEIPGRGQAGPPSGPDVFVRADGKEHRFSHPTSVTIGRHPGNLVVCSSPSVSRFHARIDPRPGGWVFSNASSSGAFVEGRPVERLELEDTTNVRLGHPTAGPEIEIAPVLPAHVVQQRAERRRRQTRLRAVGAAALAALVVIGLIVGGIALFGDGDSDSAADGRLTSANLDEAKLAAVWIRASSTTTGGEPAEWFGSGSIISSDGVILTNAHVADPQAPGLEERYGPVNLVTPEYVDIAVLDDPDDPRAEPAYRARVLASDGELDASVLQIFATYEGEEIDPADLDLPTVEIGDSDSLRTGDEITVLGFPGISQSASVTVTSGLVSSFVPDEALGSDRAEIDTDARIAPGNSGGMAIDNGGALVGIPSSLFGDESSPVLSGRIRAINLVTPLIDEAT